ncbi:MAG: Pimeloyl-ACP methyl ester carboxylesterase [Micrococcaceae bacterium]|nr:Pimeloyl-ACP methyl ester carboxylesterase [Micrococcaceae bacterium]
MDVLHERRRTVASGGAELAVFEYGRIPGPRVPTLVLVHGYPDDHRLFLPVIRELSATHRVIAYDTRNAGSSLVTRRPANFTLSALVNDLFAVLNATEATGVQLVGHDWGSIQGWAAVQDPRAVGRISSYTSISGPDLNHFSRWLRASAGDPKRWPQLVGQLLRSLYVPAFLIPVLPEAAWRLFLARSYEKKARRPVGDNPIRGLALYRTNVRRLSQPKRTGTVRVTEPARVVVPVQVVVPVLDPFLSPHLVDGLESWVMDLTVTRVDGGHWWPATHAQELARLLRSTPGHQTNEK